MITTDMKIETEAEGRGLATYNFWVAEANRFEGWGSSALQRAARGMMVLAWYRDEHQGADHPTVELVAADVLPDFLHAVHAAGQHDAADVLNGGMRAARVAVGGGGSLGDALVYPVPLGSRDNLEDVQAFVAEIVLALDQETDLDQNGIQEVLDCAFRDFWEQRKDVEMSRAEVDRSDRVQRCAALAAAVIDVYRTQGIGRDTLLTAAAAVHLGVTLTLSHLTVPAQVMDAVLMDAEEEFWVTRRTLQEAVTNLASAEAAEGAPGRVAAYLALEDMGVLGDPKQAEWAGDPADEEDRSSWGMEMRFRYEHYQEKIMAVGSDEHGVITRARTIGYEITGETTAEAVDNLRHGAQTDWRHTPYGMVLVDI